ncbi:MAG: class I SAM-dependent methyltransferase [Balneolaceae bacterium]|nr:MAG: class I SAM-dependent methyltransferase [Balneolaceae bacterium]
MEIMENQDLQEYPSRVNKWKNQFSRWSHQRLHQKARTRSRQGLYEFLDPLFESIEPGMNVLQIGSDGEVYEKLLEKAAENHFTVTTCDIVEEKNPDILGDLCTLDLGEENYDVIVCSEVIEHLHSPHLAVDNMHRALKKGGKLIVTIPFMFPVHADPYDFVRYTKTGLKNLLKMFESVEVTERNSYFEAIDVLWVRTLYLKSDHSFILTRIIVPFVYYLKRPITLLLTKLFPSDAITTGYNVLAIK